MKVSIIGQGYVGLSLAVTAAKSGYEVVGFDVNEKLVAQLQSKVSHVEGIVDADLHVAGFRATSNAADVNGSDILIIAVPTPLDEARNLI